MNAFVAKLVSIATVFLAPAALVAADTFHTAQFTTTNGYTPNLTLLTGPHFLSPAPHGTVSLSSSGSGTLTFTSSSGLRATTPTFYSVSAEKISAPTDAELRDAEQQLQAAQERLAKLQAERAAVLARQSATPHLSLKPSGSIQLSADPTHFDATLPDLPTSLVRKPFVKSAPGVRDDVRPRE
jgi:hypothetical protein